MSNFLKCKDTCKCSGTLLDKKTLADYKSKLSPNWTVDSDHHLLRDFKFPNFVTALDFTNQIGAIAEEHNHHPDIHLSWGQVSIMMYTHRVDGLTDQDFVLAQQIETAYQNAL